MLAVVKKPHIEISINGNGAKEAISWLRKKFKLIVISEEASSENSVNIEDTDFWKEMQENRVGNLLEAARLKADLSQKQLAKKIDIKQNMVSDYENGKRRLTKQMASRIAQALNIKSARLI
jgi:ribosome-binding protein aMBF1 (putative translation factor)